MSFNSNRFKKMVENSIVALSISLIFFHPNSQLLSQNHIVNGVIKYKDSNESPAPGVSVGAFGANQTYSTNNGFFQLVFSSLPPGSPIKIQIGGQDSAGKTIKVINPKDLEVFIPFNPNEKIFEIYVCESKECISSQSNALSVENFFKTFPKQIIDEQNRLIKDLLEKEMKLSEQVETLLTCNACVLFEEASQLYKNKRNVDEALGILSEEKIDSSFKVAIKKREDAEMEIKTAIEVLDLKIQLLLIDSKLEEAKIVQQKMEKICFENHSIISLPNWIKFWTTWSYCYYYSGEFQKAKKYHEKIATLFEALPLSQIRPELAEVFLFSSELYFLSEEYEKSIEYAQKIINSEETNKHPQNQAAAFQLLAFNQVSMSNPSNAIYFFEKAISITESQTKPDSTFLVNLYLDIASSLRLTKKFHESIYYLNKAAKISSASSSYLNFEYGATHFISNEMDKAEPFLKKFLENEKSTKNEQYLSMANTMLASIYYSHKEYEKSIKHQKLAISYQDKIKNPDQKQKAILLTNLAAYFQEDNQTEEAIECCFKALDALKSINYQDSLNAGYIYERLAFHFFISGKPNVALEYFLKAKRIGEKNTDASKDLMSKLEEEKTFILSNFYSRGMINFLSGQYSEAISSFDTILSSSLDSSVLEKIGICHYYLGEYPKALEAFKQLNLLDGSSSRSNYHRYLGMIAVNQRDLKAAKSHIEIFEEQNPTNPHTYFLWSMYFAKKENNSKSIKFLEKAFETGFWEADLIKKEKSFSTLFANEKFQKIFKEIERRFNEFNFFQE